MQGETGGKHHKHHIHGIYGDYEIVSVCLKQQKSTVEDGDADIVSYDRNDDAMMWGDELCVFAGLDVILKWIEEGSRGV